MANSILKNEFFSSKSSLIESSAVDTLNYNSFGDLTTLINLNRIMDINGNLFIKIGYL